MTAPSGREPKGGLLQGAAAGVRSLASPSAKPGEVDVPGDGLEGIEVRVVWHDEHIVLRRLIEDGGDIIVILPRLGQAHHRAAAGLKEPFLLALLITCLSGNDQ